MPPVRREHHNVVPSAKFPAKHGVPPVALTDHRPTPIVITAYGLVPNRHSLTHPRPSSLHTASLRTGTRSLTPTFITVYGMSYESDNSVAILSLVSRNPFWTTHNTKIRSAERKAGQTKVCQFYRLVFLLGYRQCDHLSLAIEPSSWYIGRMSEWRDLNS